MKKTKMSEDEIFLKQLLRVAEEFSQFTKSYNEQDVELFELSIYSQNFSLITHKLMKKLADPKFVMDNYHNLDDLYFYQNFFIQAWNLIERTRMDASNIKIMINEFVFSEN